MVYDGSLGFRVDFFWGGGGGMQSTTIAAAFNKEVILWAIFNFSLLVSGA